MKKKDKKKRERLIPSHCGMIIHVLMGLVSMMEENIYFHLFSYVYRNNLSPTGGHVHNDDADEYVVVHSNNQFDNKRISSMLTMFYY